MPPIASRAVRFAVASALLILTGCLDRPRPDDPSVPPSATARKAVEAMLAAWKAGRAPGQIEEGTPRILVNDSFRVAGQQLDRYEILGEVKNEKSRDISIRVYFTHPEATEIVKYRVMGLNPVLLMREEDYQLISHWEHKMEEGDASPAPATPADPKTPR